MQQCVRPTNYAKYLEFDVLLYIGGFRGAKGAMAPQDAKVAFFA